MFRLAVLVSNRETNTDKIKLLHNVGNYENKIKTYYVLNVLHVPEPARVSELVEAEGRLQVAVGGGPAQPHRGPFRQISHADLEVPGT